jgi:sec-independent protein translocase protein TatC
MIKNKKNNSAHEEMSFLDHLEEFRWHLIRSILAITILGLLAFVFKEIVFDVILMAPKSPGFFTNQLLCDIGKLINIQKLCINANTFQIINIKMTGQFMSHIIVSVVTGIILGFPYLIYEIWRFIKPALYKHEIKHTRGIIFFASVLFIIGVLFGFYIVCPLSVHFFGSYSVSSDIPNTIHLSYYISMIASILLSCGILFQMPLVIYFLSKSGLITPRFLKKYRRHAVVIILVLAAIITPPDIITLGLVSLPLLLLYELGIKISGRIMEKQLRKKHEDT